MTCSAWFLAHSGHYMPMVLIVYPVTRYCLVTLWDSAFMNLFPPHRAQSLIEFSHQATSVCPLKVTSVSPSLPRGSGLPGWGFTHVFCR